MIAKKHITQMETQFKELQQSLNIDPRIIKSIDHQNCLIGKELFICDQLEGALDLKSKDLALFYFLRLFQHNMQTYESLKKELKDDNKQLNNRIDQTLKTKKVLKELYKNLLITANDRLDISKKHADMFKENDKDTYHHMHLAEHHRKKAEKLYDTLLRKDIAKILKKLVLSKMLEMYDILLELSKETGKAIHGAVQKGTLISLQKASETVTKNIHKQNLYLRHFATSYSKSLIHSAKYTDHYENKIILYTHPR